MSVPGILSRDGIITAGVWAAGTLTDINCKIATARRGYNKRRIRSRVCISPAVKFVASLKSRAFLPRAKIFPSLDGGSLLHYALANESVSIVVTHSHRRDVARIENRFND